MITGFNRGLENRNTIIGPKPALARNKPLRKGIADHILHDPIAQETHLIADEGNHVLFWDEEKKLFLSAPEILIQHGEEDLVKGLGTVRFTFTEEEGKKIDELFHHQNLSH